MTSMRARLAFRNGPGQLAATESGSRPGRPKGGKSALVTDAKAIAKLKERLWAESRVGGRRSVLVVLQGIDTSGKGGVTSHVVGACGPIGVQYHGFGKPTAEELEHDFLWRIRNKLPIAGSIGIFDRSHYEDVLVPRVHGTLPAEVIDERYRLINEFESELVAGGTTVLKVFLHIGYDTQRERLLARLDNPDKHWKFAESDIDERARWADYQAAFQAMLLRCDTDAAPWYVVPSDHKKYRNWAVAELLHETMRELDPKYPELNWDVPALKARLAPPN